MSIFLPYCITFLPVVSINVFFKYLDLCIPLFSYYRNFMKLLLPCWNMILGAKTNVHLYVAP